MFKHVTINLTEPICNCEFQDFAWEIIPGPGCKIYCKQCGTSITIPNKKFAASFNLDKKYPKYECTICDKLHDNGLTHDQAIIKEIIE